MKARAKGIYCLEIGEWYGSLKDKNSVEPVLQLLHDSPDRVPYIHRDVATEEELQYYLRKWVQSRHVAYPILYLAFHGSPGCIHVAKANGRTKEIPTDALFAQLAGKCHKRVIHFGACKVLDIHGHTVRKYLNQSGAVAISGYASNIDWVLSTIFDLYYLAALQENQFTKSGMHAVEARLHQRAYRLTRQLRFRMRVSK
jgi:hypothetical protein